MLATLLVIAVVLFYLEMVVSRSRASYARRSTRLGSVSRATVATRRRTTSTQPMGGAGKSTRAYGLSSSRASMAGRGGTSSWTTRSTCELRTSFGSVPAGRSALGRVIGEVK